MEDHAVTETITDKEAFVFISRKKFQNLKQRDFDETFASAVLTGPSETEEAEDAGNPHFRNRVQVVVVSTITFRPRVAVV